MAGRLVLVEYSTTCGLSWSSEMINKIIWDAQLGPSVAIKVLNAFEERLDLLCLIQANQASMIFRTPCPFPLSIFLLSLTQFWHLKVSKKYFDKFWNFWHPLWQSFDALWRLGCQSRCQRCQKILWHYECFDKVKVDILRDSPKQLLQMDNTRHKQANNSKEGL